MKLSVILPIYNAERYLHECLDSILKAAEQVPEGVEVICVDDGSTDRSLEIVKAYAERHENFRVLQEENRGAGAARNAGLEVATGKFLAFCDPDDYYHPDAFGAMLAMAEREDADITFCKIQRFDNVTREVLSISEYAPYVQGLIEAGVHSFTPSDAADFLFRIVGYSPCDKLFRRDLIGRTGLRFQTIRRTNDMFFSCVALANAKRIAVVDASLYCYRKGIDSVTSKDGLAGCFCDALTALRDRLLADGMFDRLCPVFSKIAVQSAKFNLRSIASECDLRRLYPIVRQRVLELSAGFDFSQTERYQCKAARNFRRLLEENETPDFLMNDRRSKVAMHIGEDLRDAQGPIQPEFVYRDDDPLVSVVMPVYNTAESLVKCLDSLQKQTLRNIELICVDDSSTDGSRAILDAYAKDDPRVKVLTTDHKGACYARYEGLRRVRGKYVYFMDSNDTLDLCAFQECVETCEAQDLDHLVFASDVFASAEDQEALQGWIDRFEEKYRLDESVCNFVLPGPELMTRMFAAQSYFVDPPFRLIRSDLVLRTDMGLPDARFHADNYFTAVCLYLAKRAMAIPKKYYHRCVRIGSISTSDDFHSQMLHYYGCVNALLALCQFKPFQEQVKRGNRTIIKAIRSVFEASIRRSTPLTEDELRNAIWQSCPVMPPEMAVFWSSCVMPWIKQVQEKETLLAKLKESNSRLKCERERLLQEQKALRQRPNSIKSSLRFILRQLMKRL